MINLTIEERALLVRDLDDWRNLVEYLVFKKDKANKKYVADLGEVMAKTISFIYPTDINEQHTRH